MPLDASIPLQVRAPQVNDPIEQYGKVMTIGHLMQQSQLGDVQLRQAVRNEHDDQQLSDALKGLAPEDRANPMKLRDLAFSLGQAKKGMEFGKAALDQQAKDAEMKKNLATADKTTLETIKARTGMVAGVGQGALSAYQDAISKNIPEPMARALAQPIYEQGVQSLVQNGVMKDAAGVPQSFDPQYVKARLTETLSYDQMVDNELKDRAERRQQTNTTSEVMNRDQIPDGKGGYVTNVPRQQSKIQVAQASRPVTNVTVNTEKKYGEQFGKLIADADVAMRDAAIKAPDLATRANQIKEVLASGKVLTGTGADVRLQIGKALNLAGANDGEVVANTELLSTQLARNTLDAIKASGLGSGSGFSNADRDFLEKAVGGKIDLQKETIDRLANLAHKAADKSAQQWQSRVKQIPPEAVQGTGIGNESISVPPLYQSSTGAGAARIVTSLPDPAKNVGHTATDQGSGVRYRSDGVSWKRVP